MSLLPFKSLTPLMDTRPGWISSLSQRISGSNVTGKIAVSFFSLVCNYFSKSLVQFIALRFYCGCCCKYHKIFSASLFRRGFSTEVDMYDGALGWVIRTCLFNFPIKTSCNKPCSIPLSCTIMHDQLNVSRRKSKIWQYWEWASCILVALLLVQTVSHRAQRQSW